MSLPPNLPSRGRELVLIGGGHAHVEVIRRFGMQPEPDVRVTVVSRDIETPYSGMLPGLVAGLYGFDDTHIDLGPLARQAQVRLLQDEVVGLDLAQRRVICARRPPIAYDCLSIDIGSSPSLAVPGAAAHAMPVKPVSDFHRRWEILLARVLASTARLRIGVVGGGAGGVELLMAVRHRLLQALAPAGAARLSFHLLCAGPDILPGHCARARRLYWRALRAAQVDVRTDSTVTRVDATGVDTARGERVALDEILWVTSAAAPAWPRAAGLATTDDGFIRVEPSLRSVSTPDVFAAGDIAHVDAYPRPKAGVYAVRQGPPLTDNLRRALRGDALETYTPQREALSLISTGGRYAIASRGPFAFGGEWVWRWKDHIDRRFMTRYRQPMMNTMPMASMTATPDAQMRCGGCGSKIGADVLHEVLRSLDQPAREDIVIGLDAPDDAAVVALPPDTLAVQTVDAFRSFIDDPWLFGRIAANHCLGDIFAMGAVPQTALALVTLPVSGTRRMQEDLKMLLAGALDLLREEHTMLVGGHTAEGAELSLGFAVNGHVAASSVRRKRGACAGDVLLLTKPLGTGVLLAAQMQGLAKWRWLAAALDSMSRSGGPAARCLMQHGPHAMTDVTGFGLAGHLLELLGDESLAARLSLSALPVFDGAAELAARGILSTLHPENLRVSERMGGDEAARRHPHYPLCFDPQTAGGLLCALPRAQAAAALAALHATGVTSGVIVGEVIARDDGGPHQVLLAP